MNGPHGIPLEELGMFRAEAEKPPLRLGDCTVINYEQDEVPDNPGKTMEREPCPFCGSTSTALTYSEGSQVVMCLNCKATGPRLLDTVGEWQEDDLRTMSLWNARITPEMHKQHEKERLAHHQRKHFIDGQPRNS